jgi:hypothetical protein
MKIGRITEGLSQEEKKENIKGTNKSKPRFFSMGLKIT